jgi:phospholipase C
MLRRTLRYALGCAACLWLMPPGSCHSAAPALVTLQPPSSALVRSLTRDPAASPTPGDSEMLRLLRRHVKYVFVLFQENRSFDSHFGTFPSADGLFSQPAARTPGFRQRIVDTDGTVTSISPFLITPTLLDPSGTPVPLYPADTDSTDHTHDGINNSLDFDTSTMLARNDRYALDEEGLTTQDGPMMVW